MPHKNKIISRSAPLKAIVVRRLRALLNSVSARTRIAIGQISILIGVLLLAMTLGLIPSASAAARERRSQICETIAICGSAFVERGDLNAFESSLRSIQSHNPDILSAGVRRDDGKLLIDVGEHERNWPKLGQTVHGDSLAYVGMYNGNSRWGTIEIRFRPLLAGGWAGYLLNQQAGLLLFVSSACGAMFLYYLRKMLQHLDPSKVVPTRVRSALDTLAEGLLVVDSHGRIVLSNQAFATIVGRKADELLGSHAASLPWDGTADPEFVYPWQIKGKGDTVRRGIMMRLTDAAGEKRTFVVNASPVLGHDGAHRGALVSFEDITKLEQKEIELRKSTAAAESANRAKSEFLARMSHEIRTPMNAILGFTDVLRRGYEENELERMEYLETIHGSGQHLLDLINDILDLSKIEAGKLQIELAAYSPHRLISESLRVLSVRAEQKGLELSAQWESQVPEAIITDATRLRQAVTNLVGNAIKFTDKGSVRVVARVVDAPRDKKSPPASMLQINVIDTGIGMNEEAMSRIFQPFSQADTSITRRFGGTGLGLSISKQIAEALGGSLVVASEPGKGSVFTLMIQAGSLADVRMLSQEQLEAVAADALKAEKTSVALPPAKILLVEDGESNRKLISLVLTRAGATIEMAEDGKAGSDMALAGRYDVILMDMQMPVMDGYTAARLLRERGLTTPIIALTAHAMREDEEKCRAAGCSGFLTKPIDVDRLILTVAEAMGAATVPMARKSATASMPAAEPRPDLTPIRSTLPTEDPDFCEIVIEFLDRLHGQLGQMQEAWSRKDLGELASLAHWLKGSGGTAGFASLTDSARLLETLAREQQLQGIQGQIDSLQSLVARIEPPRVDDCVLGKSPA